MKRKYIKASNYLLGLLLTSIGFSSCTKDNENSMLMYGTPTADYQISGKVTDMDSEPIEGISVSVFGRDIIDARTDEDGNYKFDITTSGIGELDLTFEDVDGVENGEFETKERTESFKDSDFKDQSENDWYLGKATRTVDVKLTQKSTSKE